MHILFTPKETMMFNLKGSRLTSLPDAIVLLTYIWNVPTSILSWHSDSLDLFF